MRRAWWLAAALMWTTACGGGRTETRADAPPMEDDDADVPVVPPVGPATALDVLFVVDNGFAAPPSQRVLAQTIPYFVDRLTNPRCVNGFGQIVDNPASLDQPCEVGVRDFAPQTDVRIGVISTSVGGHGADTCSPVAPDYDPSQEDNARLLTRDPGGGVVASYQGLGFLSWDPQQQASPPGQADQDELASRLRRLIEGGGQDGCRFPAPLEAAYRFLVDPSPPAAVQVENGVAVRQGVDTTVLRQRDDFLRPQSAVLVVLVSDRDDCSIRDGGQFYLGAQRQAGGMPFTLPRPRSECAADPDDPCCRSCGESQGDCPADPACNTGPLSEAEDPLSLRCFEQKRRFGLDFNYPLSRYLDGFRERDIVDEVGDVVRNPLFAEGRRPERVMVAALTGVPWPDIAIAANDLTSGLVPATEVTWSRLLARDGEPAADPLMRPSLVPRTGENPVTGDALAPPTAGPLANATNGHEHALPATPQFACIFPLDPPRSCGGGQCECDVPGLSEQNPVCQDPTTGTYDATQRFGRATPAPRTLTFVEEMGARGLLGTLCAGDDTSPSGAAFGFKPSVDAMMRGLRRHLVPFTP